VPAVSGRRRAEDDKAASRGYFDGEAGRYESHRRWRRVLREQARALGALELQPEDELLDVGCGSGLAVREAAPFVTRAIGLDLSPGMIEEARRLALHLDNVAFELGDAEKLPFADGVFSAVLCSTSIHHYPQPDSAVREMARVLARGGRIAIGDSNPEQLIVRIVDRRLKRDEPGHLGFRSPDEIARFLDEAGFAEIILRRQHRRGSVIALARKR
jgi:demethylmenaquinone methyltransferase/2-methoxy-6-polyprenyl-1,4-benzoquinol methylase